MVRREIFMRSIWGSHQFESKWLRAQLKRIGIQSGTREMGDIVYLAALAALAAYKTRRCKRRKRG